jgi:hypothetical protein
MSRDFILFSKVDKSMNEHVSSQRLWVHSCITIKLGCPKGLGCPSLVLL